MEFKTWFFEVLNQDVDDLEFVQDALGRYTVTFFVGSNKYRINFDEEEITFKNHKIDNIWTVGFYRQGQGEFSKNYKPTNEGKGMYEVYAKVLTAMKKLMQKTNVNGFSFAGATQSQDLIYDKLAKKFGQDFIKVSETIYLKKNVLKGILSGTSNAYKANTYSDILSVNRDKRNFLNIARQRKNDQREKFRTLSNLKGKVISFLYFSKPITAYIIDVNAEKASLIMINPLNQISSETIRLQRIENIAQASPENTKYLINRMKANSYYSTYVQ